MACRTRFFWGALLLVALALRLGYLWEHRASPFFDAPIVDAQTFLKQAQALSSGPFWGGDEPYWQPPLYIYLLAFVYWLLPASYFVGIRLVHAGLGVLSCLLVYALARHAFGEQVGRIAGVMAALCGSLLYFEGELLAVPVEVFLNLLLLYGLLLAWRRDRGRDWVLAGFIAGLAALTRPNILLFIAAFCAWALWHRRTSACRSLLLFMVPIALVILPVTYRNWTIEPDLVFISSNAGVNFYIGNNADYERTVSLRPGMQWEDMIAEPAHWGHETATARSAFFFGQILQLHSRATPRLSRPALQERIPLLERPRSQAQPRHILRPPTLVAFEFLALGLVHIDSLRPDRPTELARLGTEYKGTVDAADCLAAALCSRVHGLGRTLLSSGSLPHAGRTGADRLCCFCRLSTLLGCASQSLYPHHSSCRAFSGSLSPVQPRRSRADRRGRSDSTST